MKKKAIDQAICKDDHKGNAVYAHQIRYLNKKEVSELGVAQQAPGKTRQEIGSDDFQPYPKAPHHKDQDTRSLHTAEQVCEECRVEGKV